VIGDLVEVRQGGDCDLYAWLNQIPAQGGNDVPILGGNDVAVVGGNDVLFHLVIPGLTGDLVEVRQGGDCDLYAWLNQIPAQGENDVPILGGNDVAVVGGNDVPVVGGNDVPILGGNDVPVVGGNDVLFHLVIPGLTGDLVEVRQGGDCDLYAWLNQIPAQGGNDGVSIGGNDGVSIGGDDGVSIGGDDGVSIGGDDGPKVGGNDMQSWVETRFWAVSRARIARPRFNTR